MADDFKANTGTTGTVAVGGSATGEIEAALDVDWFAVELEAGKACRIDLEGKRTGGGTLRDSALWGIHDADGNFITGTADDNGGMGKNSRVIFTPTESATYYVAAGGNDRHTGTAGRVAVGGTATGEIELPGDREMTSRARCARNYA